VFTKGITMSERRNRMLQDVQLVGLVEGTDVTFRWKDRKAQSWRSEGLPFHCQH
jgi:hypothetical protein